MSLFHHLFAPIKIGNVYIENRIAMAPMATLGYGNENGGLSQRAIEYYLERARGRVGLIITGTFKVENAIDPLTENVPLISPTLIPALTELAEAVHAFGTKLFIQLSAGFGRVASPLMLLGQPVSASTIPNFWDPNIKCNELSVDDIQAIVESFGNAAEIVALCGVDGIELHGHEGYLFDQFMTNLWNKRSDQYGGSLENRLRFPLQVLQEIKKRLSPDFPVQYRYGLKHYVKAIHHGAVSGEQFEEAGRDTNEGIEIGKKLEKAGFDALHVDAGCYDSWYWAHPPNFMGHGCLADLIAKVKREVNIPVIGVGRLDDPFTANRVVGEGKMDLAAIGRGLLADPHWVKKIRKDQAESIRPCIACHEGCLNRIFEGKPLSCSLNPTVGRERRYAAEPIINALNTVVVGGGIGGLEAARVLGLRGHHVKLFEKRNDLGGHVIAGSVPEFKRDLRRLLQWYERQLKEEGVEVVVGKAVNEDLLNRQNADLVIFATGSYPVAPKIHGLSNENSMFVSDLLMKGDTLEGDVVTIIGGGHSGCEAALHMAQKKRKVRIVEMLPELMMAGMTVPYVNKKMLLDLLDYYEVEVLTSSCVVEISNTALTITDKDNKDRRFNSDIVAYATGMAPDRRLYDKFKNNIPGSYLVGDAREPRNIQAAIWEAYEVGRTV